MAEERLGASFTIDITSLKAGLNTANKLIRESQSEFKAAAAGLDNWQKSEEGLNAKIKSLNQIIPIQQEKVNALKKQYQQFVQNGLDPTSNRAIELRTQINREEAALESNRAELKRQTDALAEMENASDEAGDQIEETGKQAEKSSGSFTVLKGALANLVADGFRMAIQAAKDFTKEMVNVGITFDDSMAKVGAVSGATGTELEKLRQKAEEMGSTTKFTASEAAEAFNYMAMAGWKTEDMLGGIDGILNLAAASGADLATTSDIVTDALTAMGYAAKDAGRLADVMAAASSNANTNVELMGMTFQYAAPIVGALGYSMEDTAVAIGLMANAGIKGEKSGTALRSILTRLSAPPSECANAMEELGISITDSGGKMKSLDTVMQDLRAAFANLSETEQTAAAKHIAGAEAMSGLLAIVNAAPEDFNKLTEAVAGAEGAAASMAGTMLDTVGGDMTVLKSQIEGVQLTIYKEFEPTLRKAVQNVQKWLSKVDWKAFGKKAVKSVESITKTFKSFTKNVLPALKKALELLGKAVNFVIDNFGTLAKIVLTAVTAFKAFQAVMAVSAAITAVQTALAGLTAGVGLATKATAAFNAVMAANPIGAVLTAISLLIAALVILVQRTKETAEEIDVLSESQRKTADAAKETAQAFKDQKAATDELVGAQVANVNYVRDTLLPQLETLIDTNGEVKAGEEARAQFILNELNNALGTEYTSLQQIIDQNGKIKQSIYDVIEAKKAQIMLEGYEEEYRAALAETAEAEKRRATEAQGLAKADELRTQARQELEKAQRDYNQAVYTQSVVEMWAARTALNEAEENYDAKRQLYRDQKAAYEEATRDAQGYYDTISAYEQANTAVLEGNSAKAVEILTNYGNGFKTATSVQKESVDEQQRILGQQVVDTEVNLQLMEADYAKYSEGMTDEEKAQAQARLENARKQANDAKTEFQKVGGNITKGMAAGAEAEEWQLSDAMQSIISKAVEAAKKAAGIQSPSRLFRKAVGLMIGAGIAAGIDDSTKQVVTAVQQQVRDIENEYALDGFAHSVNTGISARQAAAGGAQAQTGGGVVVNQYNTYSQAHSRYELYKTKQQTAAAVRLALGTV